MHKDFIQPPSLIYTRGHPQFLHFQELSNTTSAGLLEQNFLQKPEDLHEPPSLPKLNQTALHRLRGVHVGYIGRISQWKAATLKMLPVISGIGIHMVVFQVPNNNFCKNFCFKRGWCWCSNSSQDPWRSCILQQVRVMSCMSSSGHGKLQCWKASFDLIIATIIKCTMQRKATEEWTRSGFTWRRAKAEQALSMEEWFRNIATNLPISAALKRT